jgi:hypothetical protein
MQEISTLGQLIPISKKIFECQCALFLLQTRTFNSARIIQQFKKDLTRAISNILSPQAGELVVHHFLPTETFVLHALPQYSMVSTKMMIILYRARSYDWVALVECGGSG